MKAIANTATRNASGVKRGLVEGVLLKIANSGGYKIVPVSPAQMAKSKGNSRLSDIRRIKSRKATSEQIQSKNDMVPGKIEVLDWSPIFD